MISLLILLSFCYLSSALSFYFNVTNWNEDEFKNVLDNSRCGDLIKIAAGEYEIDGNPSYTLDCNDPSQPITIEGEVDPETGSPSTKITVTNKNRNVLELNGGGNFIMQHLELTGGDVGPRLQSPVMENILFFNLHVHHLGGNAFTCNSDNSCRNVTLRSNHIHHLSGSAECVYFGCSDGSCISYNNLFEYNHCHDTGDADSGSRGSGVQLKTGSHSNVVRYNRFERLGSVAVLVYDDYDQGRNIIDGNILIGYSPDCGEKSCGDNGIQATSGATITNNVIIGSRYALIDLSNNRGLDSKGLRNLTVAHNSVYNSHEDFCLRMNKWGNVNLDSIVVANNFFGGKCTAEIFKNVGNQGASTWAGNVAVSDDSNMPSGVAVVAIADAAALVQSFNDSNLVPSADSSLVGAGSAAQTVGTDFCGTVRPDSPVTAGAYLPGASPDCPGPNPPALIPQEPQESSASSSSAMASGTGAGTGAGASGGSATGSSGSNDESSAAKLFSIGIIFFTTFALL